MLTNDHFHQIVAVLLPEMDDADARKALIESALYGSPVLQKIQWNGAAKTFAVRLVRLLTDFGEIEPDRPALIALLEQVKKEVGSDRQIEIDELLTSLKAPPDQQNIQPTPKTSTAAVNAVYGEIEIGLHQAQPQAIQVELRVTDPVSQGEIAPARGEARISPGKLLEDLLALQIDPTQYGKALANYIFQDRNVRELFSNTKAAFERSGLMLRLRLLIGPSVPQLHGLRWELLCDPLTLKPLATSERILFSRFMLSRDWRVIKLRPKSELKALIAVSAPSDLADYRMADVDKQGEIARARESLAGIQATVVGRNEPLTLVSLMDAIRQGVDVLYLVCHGSLSKELVPYLFLQGEDGKTAMTPAGDFAQRVSELAETPCLIVLASCESAGREDGGYEEEGRFAAQAALAPRLAEAGVPAVMAMQGKISMKTVKLAMPVFFHELLKDGQIDRAMAVARGTVRERDDSWMPALFTRLKSGRIWDEPGFAGGSKEEVRTLPPPLQALLDKIRNQAGEIKLSVDQANAIKDHKPANLTEYRLCRIAEWSLPRYQLDKRFVNLTLSIDQGEDQPERWRKIEDFRSQDLREVLEKRKDDPVLVLLGKPGSGKSTLLRHLQLDLSSDQLRDDSDQITFFIQLNEYQDALDPKEWLRERWSELYGGLPSLESYLKKGQVLLLLDALNEMPHGSIKEYNELAGKWRIFAHQASRSGNRILFSCRSFDYGGRLSSKELPVPQIVVQPMDEDQVREFLRLNTPDHYERIWDQIKEPRQFELYQTPYFMDMLCQVVGETGEAPKGRAGLFTYFVRLMLKREKSGELFQPDTLLTEFDHYLLDSGVWPNSFELPEDGELLRKLSDLAFKMQEKGRGPERSQVRISHAEACKLIDHEDRARDILKAGVSLNVIDIDASKKESVAYYHQLLQEYFAARRLVKDPNPALVHVEWAVGKVTPSLEEKLSTLQDVEPLPLIDQTGWEETTLTAAPMANDTVMFIRDLIPHNLPLAARCAASPELNVDEGLKREIQNLLIVRIQDMKVDLRARIAAGEALGTIGDPRFERRSGLHGDYLLPPMVEIPGGAYPIGNDQSGYNFEKPAHTVKLAPFQIGRFPMTNAEYAMFIAARGYEVEQWWDTTEALAWLRGEASTEGQKESWRENRRHLLQTSEDNIRAMTNFTLEQKDVFITVRNWTEEYFENWLSETFPAGKLYRQPEYWDDTRFNNPAQPVVGVTWFEARAYCNWLSANIAGNQIFRLPTEVEFEAAARGKKGRMFPYPKTFDKSRSNTFESHIRRTTPVGIFDNATPEGAFDLSGNAYTWTLSIYDQEKYPYPYRSDDNREDIHQEGVKRVLRGGAWVVSLDVARAVYRVGSDPVNRYVSSGFRVVGVVRPPSL